MRKTLLLVLLITVVALSSAMPRNCRGSDCRHFRPSSPERRGSPGPSIRPYVGPITVRSPAPAPSTYVPVTGSPVTELSVTAEDVPVTEPEMITDTDGEEVREAGVNGWLAAPTPAPLDIKFAARTQNTSKSDKAGSCDTPKGFGIKCMMRLDQCRTDHHCPGSTKCCMVGECGYLCVKPKPISTEPKEVTKEVTNKKNKGDKTIIKGKEEDLATESSEISESVELAEGALKAEDIIEKPEEIMEKEDMTEEVEDVEQLKEMMKKSGDEITKEVEKEEESFTKQVEKVIEEVVEEVLEEEIEEMIKEDVEATTQVPIADEDETPSEE